MTPPTVVPLGLGRPRSWLASKYLVLGISLVAGGILMTLGAHRAKGSTAVIVALLTAVIALIWLARSARRYGLFTVGGITWAMFATLFVGRWFFPPVSAAFITPQAVTYYNRDGAFIASSLMIAVFAITYSTVNRPSVRGRRRSAPPASSISSSSSVADVAAVSILLIVLRLATGVIFHLGIPGRLAVGVPFVGVIFYATSYGPLAGASLILWFGKDNLSSARVAGGILLCDVLVESALGSHGHAFLAILVFGTTKAAIARPIRVTATRALSLGVLMSLLITAALFISFVAREPLNGGARQRVGDVPAFLATRFGGLEYVAPVIGAVDHTGSSMRNLRTSNWSRYMTAEVYGLPPETHTGFAATAVGWFYGVRRLQGVAIGAAICGVLASRFDRWCHARRRNPSRLSVALAVGGLLGWATFLLGGTIGSLTGISIGYTAIAMALAHGHRFVSQVTSQHHAVQSDLRRRPTFHE